MKKLIVLLALILTAGIVCGQTVQKGNVIGAYALKVQLDPDVTMNQFTDKFINYYIPIIEKNFEGVTVFLMKGYTGTHAGGYGLYIHCKDLKVYDKYWDKEGQLTEDGKKAWDACGDAHENINKMGKLSWDFTDWVLL